MDNKIHPGSTGTGVFMPAWLGDKLAKGKAKKGNRADITRSRHQSAQQRTDTQPASNTAFDGGVRSPSAEAADSSTSQLTRLQDKASCTASDGSSANDTSETYTLPSPAASANAEHPATPIVDAGTTATDPDTTQSTQMPEHQPRLTAKQLQAIQQKYSRDVQLQQMLRGGVNCLSIERNAASFTSSRQPPAPPKLQRESMESSSSSTATWSTSCLLTLPVPIAPGNQPASSIYSSSAYGSSPFGSTPCFSRSGSGTTHSTASCRSRVSRDFSDPGGSNRWQEGCPASIHSSGSFPAIHSNSSTPQAALTFPPSLQPASTTVSAATANDRINMQQQQQQPVQIGFPVSSTSRGFRTALAGFRSGMDNHGWSSTTLPSLIEERSMSGGQWLVGSAGSSGSDGRADSSASMQPAQQQQWQQDSSTFAGNAYGATIPARSPTGMPIYTVQEQLQGVCLQQQQQQQQQLREDLLILAGTSPLAASNIRASIESDNNCSTNVTLQPAVRDSRRLGAAHLLQPAHQQPLPHLPPSQQQQSAAAAVLDGTWPLGLEQQQGALAWSFGSSGPVTGSNSTAAAAAEAPPPPPAAAAAGGGTGDNERLICGDLADLREQRVQPTTLAVQQQAQLEELAVQQPQQLKAVQPSQAVQLQRQLQALQNEQQQLVQALQHLQVEQHQQQLQSVREIQSPEPLQASQPDEGLEDYADFAVDDEIFCLSRDVSATGSQAIGAAVGLSSTAAFKQQALHQPTLQQMLEQLVAVRESCTGGGSAEIRHDLITDDAHDRHHPPGSDMISANNSNHSATHTPAGGVQQQQQQLLLAHNADVSRVSLSGANSRHGTSSFYGSTVHDHQSLANAGHSLTSSLQRMQYIATPAVETYSEPVRANAVSNQLLQGVINSQSCDVLSGLYQQCSPPLQQQQHGVSPVSEGVLDFGHLLNMHQQTTAASASIAPASSGTGNSSSSSAHAAAGFSSAMLHPAPAAWPAAAAPAPAWPGSSVATSGNSNAGAAQQVQEKLQQLLQVQQIQAEIREDLMKLLPLV